MVAKPKPKTARGAATRRAILAAAEQVIGTAGYNDASIAEITRFAGVAQGTFYIYFKGKEEVFRAIVLEMGRRLRGVLSEAIEASADRLDAEREGLRAFLTSSPRTRNSTASSRRRCSSIRTPTGPISRPSPTPTAKAWRRRRRPGRSGRAIPTCARGR